MLEFLSHFFLPRESNNHRAKLLHNITLSLLILILLVGQILVIGIRRSLPSVLGIATNIVSSDLLSLVNQKREEMGLSALVVNDKLALAASLKANDMFAKNYWAHSSPDGTPPWVFVKDSGYSYVYAGENLARGFNTSSEVVGAWMNSPTHKDNILSPNYNEIGFAIVNGNLLGEETTLVVQMFGKQLSTVESSVARVGSVKSEVVAAPAEILASPTPALQKPTLIPTSLPQKRESLPEALVYTKPLIDSSVFSRNLSLVILALFILVLVLDMIIIERKKIVRFIGHSLDHFLYLVTIALLIIILSKGLIL